MQKNFIKSINSKSEFIEIAKDERKLQVFMNIMEEYAKDKNERKLLYNKYKYDTL
jgi:hypothetical protein